MFKRILFTIIILLIGLNVSTIMAVNTTVNAHEVNQQTKNAGGKCGDNLSWTIDNDGTLVITGTGEMEFFWDAGPWKDYSDKIKSLVVKNGVTTIGANAFINCKHMVTAQLGKDVTNIGFQAFASCSSLKSINIPQNVKQIQGKAFKNCTNLKTIYNYSKLNIIKGSEDYGYVAYYAEEIITSEQNINSSTDNIIILIDDSDFAENGTIGDLDGDGNVNMKDVVLLQKHIANLVTLNNTQKSLADVNGDGSLTMLDVTTMQKFIAKLITSFSNLESISNDDININDEYMRFLRNKSYMQYVKADREAPYNSMSTYSIFDINADKTPELIVKSNGNPPYADCLIFTYDSTMNKIKYVNRITGYDFCYMENKKCLSYSRFKLTPQSGSITCTILNKDNLFYDTVLIWENGSYKVQKYKNQPVDTSEGNLKPVSVQSISENQAKNEYLNARNSISFKDLP
ncbi:MAG: leucine-rich repeat protein [Clostridia bacterium]|nr:leucine-rich repeat protein [Clostridia bacterium]